MGGGEERPLTTLPNDPAISRLECRTQDDLLQLLFLCDRRGQSLGSSLCGSSACFEVLIAVLLKVQVFYNIARCRLVNNYVSKDRSAFIFRVMQS
jgi:hypothetical protein